MKKFALVLAIAFFLSMGLSAAYADQKDSNMNAPSKQVASAKDTSMKQEHEAYQKKAQGELNGYKQKTKQLEAKTKNLEEKAKMEVKEDAAKLHEKMDVAEAKLKSMKSASGEAWEKTKAEFDSAMEGVKESYEKVAAHFK